MLPALFAELFFYNGSEYVYHGVNVIPSFKPYYPYVDYYSENYSFSVEDIDFLKSHGFNMITLELMIPGVFPTANTSAYSAEYFEKIREVIALCKLHNIAVIVSLYNHYVSELNCGQGFPQWLVNNSNPKWSHDFPLPITSDISRHENGSVIQEQCEFLDPSQSYFDEDAFEQIYENNDYMLLLETFWRIVLQELNGVFSNVVAYNLFTEPEISFYHGIINKVVLPKFHNSLLQPFVEVNPSVQIPIILNPVNNDFFENYTPPSVNLTLAFGFFDDNKTINNTFRESLEQFRERALEVNCSVLISSFGRNLDVMMMQNLTSAAIDMSWNYFSLKGYGDSISRCLTCSTDKSRGIILKELSVPYFSKIAGSEASEEFNFSDNSLELHFETGEIGDYSILEISTDWRLFGTSAQYFFGEDAIEIVIDEGKIKIRNVVNNVLVGLRIQ